jgi:ectoine hydroxylase-related dioxygenase (phytanoyl-CoA dioxygenase family)
MITADHAGNYQDEGYFLAERVIPEETVDSLRAECARFMTEMDRRFEAEGVEKKGLSVKGNRYFISQWYKELKSETLRRFLFSDLMQQICEATIGTTAYLFHEQFVVKGPEQGMKFSWHQDSGYVNTEHKPYVTIWCTLDDVTIENGTVYILPYSKAGTRELVKHSEDPETRDRIGYKGEEAGIPVLLPAGSVAVFSSLVFHRSGANTSPNMRRIYLPQFSPEPILKNDGSPWGWADPFIVDGSRQPLPELV